MENDVEFIVFLELEEVCLIIYFFEIVIFGKYIVVFKENVFFIVKSSVIFFENYGEVKEEM